PRGSLVENPRPVRATTLPATPTADGPESLTLAERFIVAFRLPYGVGCILVGFGLFGILNTVLSNDVETGDLRQSVVAAFSLQNLATRALFAYSFYAPRYMRTRPLEAGLCLPAPLPKNDA